jgi:signal transduction histidine kinase
MDIDQIAFRIAQVDLLLIALFIVLGGIAFWFPPPPRANAWRLSRRQLLLYRFLSVPLGLLLVWFTFTIGADPTLIRAGTRGRMYALVVITPLVVFFTFMVVVAFLATIERALGRDVERYRPLGDAVSRWGVRLLSFYRPGAVDAARRSQLREDRALRLEARKNQRTKTSTGATRRPSSARAPRSHR